MLAAACWLPFCDGCSLIVPTMAHRPVIRNPFPQLGRVAVAPFFNQSDEPTLDGRQVAMAYFAELQATPGFEVAPLGVVEEAIIAHRVDLHGPGEARRLANILGVDAVIVGAITDFSEYYPPRFGLRVEWYTANPGFHEIPAGYGLPWGTSEEEFIPDSLVYESQMALAKAEMAAKTPDCDAYCQTLPAPPSAALSPEASPDADVNVPNMPATAPAEGKAPKADGTPPAADSAKPAPPTNSAIPTSLRVLDKHVQLAAAQEELPAGAQSARNHAGAIDATGASGEGGATEPTNQGQLDPQCLAQPAPPVLHRPPCIPYNGPVLSHTRIYHGNDDDVTEALQGYVFFRNDQRFGGWKSYLARSDDYIRFCCHMHICEMLSARGGSRKTDVVWRWPERR
jgi:hypothetical protein